MDKMRNLLLLASLLLMCLTQRSSADFTCYSCLSTIDQNNVETSSPAGTSCAQVTGLTGQTGSYTGCYTKYQSTEGVTSITRGSSTNAVYNYCTNSGDTTYCYCNTTDNCNSEKIAVPTSYECYECMSSAYFDNGCGSTLNPGLNYVQKVQGCSACFKTVTNNPDGTLIYSRGCTRNIAIDEKCVNTDVGQVGKSCSCAKNLCNAAEIAATKSVSVYAVVILSAVFKLIS